MTDKLESEVTYPVFFKKSNGTLYFRYSERKRRNRIIQYY